ncbi:MAG: ribonuclease III [Gammaproteobacteria bacterium]|nr:MAG: ribonuclease III [Gammaproteobacteria bacterium]
MSDLARLQKKLDYTFDKPDLLELALTHRSAGAKNNERLEFLGDSVVNQIIAEALFRRFHSTSEGSMSRMRSNLVNGDTLAQIAQELNVGEYLILGAGERRSGGHRRSSILADALEAIIGAVLLDSDYTTTQKIVLSWFKSRLNAIENKDNKDAKTRLQEFLQGRKKALPNYELLNVSGEDHAQQFEVRCSISGGRIVASGRGSSRRKAEQQAAALVLAELEHD